MFNSIYALPRCDLDRYFSEIQVQHLPRFAYGEDIAARVESGDRLSLTRSFEGFSKYLLGTGGPWERPDNAADDESDPPLRDEAWIMEKRSSTEAARRKMNADGFMEASFFASASRVSLSHKQLYQAAQAAQISGTGWPIGAVLVSSPESRPKPTSEGISAEIIDGTKSYDRWIVREDGAFYFLRTLEEEPEYLLTDDRVARMTELLLYCMRLYSFLGLDKSTRVRISVRFEGLAGRALGCRTPEAPDDLLRLSGKSTMNEVKAEVVVELARILLDMVKLVRDLTRPLFALFDFFELPTGEYERLVGNRIRDWGFGDRR